MDDERAIEILQYETMRLLGEAEDAARIAKASVRDGVSPAVRRGLEAYANAMTACAVAIGEAQRAAAEPDRNASPAANVPDDARETILRLAITPGGVTNRALVDALKVCRVTVFRYLAALKNAGLVEQHGRGRAAVWHLADLVDA